MVLRTVKLIAALAESAVQASPQFQVVMQQPSDPWWKWLLPTVVQTIVSLLSIAAGVLIAVWSFRTNRKTEHEQWIRDQKKAEWSMILTHLSAADVKLPHVFKNTEWKSLRAEVLPALREVLPAMRNALFLSERLKNDDLAEKYKKFLSESAELIQKIDELSQTLDSLAESQATAGGNAIWIRTMEKREEEYWALYKRFHVESDMIREIALDMFTEKPSPEW
jgi:hypothetical protein